jgi:hypothetical protein
MKVDTLKNGVGSLTKYVRTEKFSWCRGSMGIASLDCYLCNLVTLCMNRKQVGECWLCVIFFVPPPPKKMAFFYVCFWVVFQHMIFVNGLLIPVKN